MQIEYLPKFKKQYKKLSSKQKLQFIDRVTVFTENPKDPALRLHPLKGSYSGYWSINVSGDLRALFYYKDNSIVIFALIGTHSQLYG